MSRTVRWTGAMALMVIVAGACLIADLILGMHCIGGGDRSCRVASPGLRFAVLGGVALIAWAGIAVGTARHSRAACLASTGLAIIAAILVVALLPV